MRWITLLGRLGTVLLMTGLALGIVWLIPSAQMGSRYKGTSSIQPEKYTTFFSMMLTPQNGLYISIQSNDSLYVYLLNIFGSTLQNWTMSWVKEQFPSLKESQIWVASQNITVLNAILESHSDIVLWKSEATNTVSKEFFPTTVSNATIVIANPSLYMIRLESEFKQVTSLGPKGRILISTQLLIPIGFVLAIPWIYFNKVRKARS